MQSKIKNDFEIETFRASLADMKQFKKYVEELEVKCADECAFKIIPPEKFKGYSNKLKPNTTLSNVVVQRAEVIRALNGIAYELSHEERKTMSYDHFLKSVKRGEPANGPIDRYEKLAWQNLRKKVCESLYAIDNPISLFDDSCKFMNLNKFSRAESLIHQGVKRMKGIHEPYLYIGTYITYFGIHLEDSDLYSINYLHEGAAKVWYFIPSSEHSKLEKLAREFGEAVATICDNFLRHKTLMIPPAPRKHFGCYAAMNNCISASKQLHKNIVVLAFITTFKLLHNIM